MSLILKKIFHRIDSLSNFLNSFAERKAFTKQVKQYQDLNINNRFVLDKDDLFPCLYDATSITYFDPHYTYHPAWAARIVRKINPTKHIDISSILHFSTQLSAFVPTDFYDYRPAKLKLSNLNSGTADLTSLPFDNNSVQCLSCMHTIEHVGLGRYGDKLDPDGDLKAICELKRVIKTGGNLLLVTPVGRPRLQFNSHRIYSYEMILDHFSEFELKDFSLVNDAGEFLSPADPVDVPHQSYGCGCFWLIKK